MTLKKVSDLKLIVFNHITVDGTVKKTYNSNNYVITKKEIQILLDYFSGISADSKKLEKLYFSAKNILKNKDIDVEDKIELLYVIEIQLYSWDKIQCL